LHALFPRTTHRYGGVTFHSYHFSVEQGLPKTQVVLWVYGEQLRAMLDNGVLAEYHCRYDWRDHKIREGRDGVFSPTPFTAIQGVLVPLNEQEVIVLYRPKSRRRQTRLPVPAQQLWLFELVQPAENILVRYTVTFFPHWCNGGVGQVCPGGDQNEAQCDSQLRPSPLLTHYPCIHDLPSCPCDHLQSALPLSVCWVRILPRCRHRVWLQGYAGDR